jgi:hypothetical protein
VPNCSGALRVTVCSVFLACCTTRLARAEQSALLIPTGSYSVGRTFFYWTDPNRADPVAARTGTKREFMVIAWYPAETNTSEAHAVWSKISNALKRLGFRSRNFLLKSMYNSGSTITLYPCSHGGIGGDRLLHSGSAYAQRIDYVLRAVFH